MEVGEQVHTVVQHSVGAPSLARICVSPCLSARAEPSMVEEHLHLGCTEHGANGDMLHAQVMKQHVVSEQNCKYKL